MLFSASADTLPLCDAVSQHLRSGYHLRHDRAGAERLYHRAGQIRRGDKKTVLIGAVLSVARSSVHFLFGMGCAPRGGRIRDFTQAVSALWVVQFW